ncbi:hypothetical protein HAX54_008920 [Datura stramonium]|uniref:Uncharacterized protein n=1 Tax=Datura stramonium TaxID=4076 RepID=A0ABS8TE77_DATST|nr:hypothetical protein [Datura stramonium]
MDKGRGRGFGEQDRPLAPNHGTHEAEDVRTCAWHLPGMRALARQMGMRGDMGVGMWQTRQVNQSKQAHARDKCGVRIGQGRHRQPHARDKCGVRLGPGRRSSHQHAASAAQNVELTPDFKGSAWRGLKKADSSLSKWKRPCAKAAYK